MRGFKAARESTGPAPKPAAAASSAAWIGGTTAPPRLGFELAEIRIAATGLTGAAQPLPHGDRIRSAFGAFGGTLTGVEAYVGGAAAAASRSLDADAYAMGPMIAFREAPDLRTAAHEATHVVQQGAGVRLTGGLGRIGDRHEQLADTVADNVVAGRSAEPTLAGIDPPPGPRPAWPTTPVVQRQASAGPGAGPGDVVLRSADAEVGERPVREVLADVRERASRYRRAITQFRRIADELRRNELRAFEDQGLIGRAFELFNAQSRPDPARWYAVIEGWDAAAALLDSSLRLPSVPGFTGVIAGALQRSVDTYREVLEQHNGELRVFDVYYAGYQTAGANVVTGLNIARDLAFFTAVVAAAGLAIPLIAAASVPTAAALESASVLTTAARIAPVATSLVLRNPQLATDLFEQGASLALTAATSNDPVAAVTNPATVIQTALHVGNSAIRARTPSASAIRRYQQETAARELSRSLSAPVPESLPTTAPLPRTRTVGPPPLEQEPTPLPGRIPFQTLEPPRSTPTGAPSRAASPLEPPQSTPTGAPSRAASPLEPQSRPSGTSSAPPDRGPVRVAYAPDVDPEVFAQEIAQRARETGRPHFLYLSSSLAPTARSPRLVVLPTDSVTSVRERLSNFQLTRSLSTQSVGADLERVDDPSGSPGRGSQRFIIQPGADISVALGRVLQIARATGVAQSVGAPVSAPGEVRSFGGVRARERIERYQQDVTIRPNDSLPEIEQRLAQVVDRRAGRAQLRDGQHVIDEAIEPGRVIVDARAERLAGVAATARASGTPQQVVGIGRDRAGREIARPVLAVSGRETPEELSQRYQEGIARLDRARPRPGEILIDEAITAGEDTVEGRRTRLAVAVAEARATGARTIVVQRTNRRGEVYLQRVLDLDRTAELGPVEQQYARAVDAQRNPQPRQGEYALEERILGGQDIAARRREELGRALERAQTEGPQTIVVRTERGFRRGITIRPSETLDDVVRRYDQQLVGVVEPDAHPFDQVFAPGTTRSEQLRDLLELANATGRVQRIVRPVDEAIGRRYEEVTRVRPGESLEGVELRLQEATERYRIIDSRPRTNRTGPQQR